MKKQYQAPAAIALRLDARATLCTVSGGTGDYESKEGKDNVVFENRQGGWSSEAWEEE